MKHYFTWILPALFFILPWLSPAQNNYAYVDDQGLLRKTTDDSEVHGFGVNYSVPFAHAYRMAERMGINHKEAIRQDIYHFARLDLDLYRVHVWDTEISDSVGNLLENEHLELFDYAIAEMKKRDMKFVITPIAFWGNGWPEPDEETPGFSNKYGKEACLTNPEAIKAQARYLEQFLNHVNPYTGMAYKNDPDVVAFEVSNEPHHGGTKEEVTEYINKLTSSMKNTGTKIPVFYNMSHSTDLADAYFDAKHISGGTYQWYPSGLVAGHAQKGNFLPHVDEYPIPFADHPEFNRTAKIVYEFDPADVAGNYMYPAMARTFRETGIQLATHFAYDAMFLAPYNTNYGTHFMSLPYAPQKALSLKIASAVFHEIPVYSDFGNYPDNTEFGDFKVSYEDNLAELVSTERFFYSNNTQSEPPQPDKLTEIAGYGNSPIVSYEGKGAYFLDKLEENIWRLEVMPDAYWLRDPYAAVSPKRQVAAVHHSRHFMSIRLPGLPDNFTATAINEGNHYSTQAVSGKFEIKPGVYLVGAEKAVAQIDPQKKFKNITLDEFVAPQSNLDTLLVKNHTVTSSNAGTPVNIEFNVISGKTPAQVMVHLSTGWRGTQLKAEKTGSNQYRVQVPEKLIEHGKLDYYILTETPEGWQTFPAGVSGRPNDWDFIAFDTYQIDILPENKPIQLWEAKENWPRTMSTWREDVSLKPTFEGAALHYEISPDSAGADEEKPLHTFKYYFADDVKGRKETLTQKSHLVVKASAKLGTKPVIEVSLIDHSGAVKVHRLTLENGKNLYKIPFQEMQPGRFAIVPRPYPGFLPYYANIGANESFNLEKTETLQVSLINNNKPANFILDTIWLE